MRTVLLLLPLVTVTMAALWFVTAGRRAPRSDRSWATDHARPVRVTMGDEEVVLHDVRDFAWTSPTTFEERYRTERIALDDVRGVWFVLAPFAKRWRGLAHSFLSFELTGERYAHPDLRIGYFAQHTVEALVAGTSPIDHLREISPNASTQDFRNFLGKWSFPGDRAFESIDGFSGGERARLALALIAWRQPNVLLLDEPTNHLDLEMREALAEALSDFAGAIVLVSHDRHLIGLVSDTYWRVSDGVVRPFDGDLDDYAAWLRSRPQDAKASEASGGAAAAKAASAASAPPPPPPAPAAKTPRINPHRLAKAEERVATLEAAIAAIEAELADPAVYADGGARGQELAQRQQALRAELQAAEEELLALYG